MQLALAAPHVVKLLAGKFDGHEALSERVLRENPLVLDELPEWRTTMFERHPEFRVAHEAL